MADEDYNSMVSRAPQGGNPNYWNLTQPQQLGANPQQAIPGPQLPQMSQGGGAQQYGAQGMPSNGGQPSFLQRFAQNAMGMRNGQQPGQQPGGGNPFLAAVARWHQAQQQRQPGAPGAPQGPQGVPPQWGPNPMPQGMRGPASMGGPPGQVPWAGQNVQWGQMPGGGNGS